MSEMSGYGPEYDAYVEHVRKEVLPNLVDSSVFVSITPGSPEQLDIKFATELGLAVMLDKPILAIIPPGAAIPQKLDRVVDRFVKVDLSNPDDQSSRDRLMQAIKEFTEEFVGDDSCHT